jgi:hypothetical protein
MNATTSVKLNTKTTKGDSMNKVQRADVEKLDNKEGTSVE